MKLTKKIAVILPFFLSLVLVSNLLTVNETNTNQNIALADKKDDESKGEKKNKDDSMWTMYAQFLMTSADDQAKLDKSKGEEGGAVQKAFKGAVAGIIGDGGVQIDIPYNKMFSIANKISDKENSRDEDADNKEGRKLASFFSTYSHYGYIETVSGNSLASEISNGLSLFFKLPAGIIVTISLILFYAISSIIKWITAVLVKLNWLQYFGFGKGDGILPKNPLSTAISNFFDGMNLNSSFFTALSEFGLMLIIFVGIVTILTKLMQRRVKEANSVLVGILKRAFMTLVYLPILCLVLSGIAQTVENANKSMKINKSPVASHLLNVGGWAASSNLSPTGFTSNEVPDASADDYHVDDRFTPVKKRNMIASINDRTYKVLYQREDDASYSFDLLARWLLNNNYNVNNYMGDIRKTADQTGDGKQMVALRGYKDQFGKKGKKISNGDIEYSMWSASPNYDDKTKKPDYDGFKPANTVGSVADTDSMPSDGGVKNSFSTQSVALMLQTSFDNNGAKFYAYNIAPTGLTASMKNASTVKTEWKEVSLPGEGVIGKFGSFLSMVSQSLSYVILGLAVVLSLLTTQLITAGIKILINIFKVIVKGSVPAGISIAWLSLAVLVATLLASYIPPLFLSLTTGIAGGVDSATGDWVPSSMIEIVVSIITLLLAWYFGFGYKIKGMGLTPVQAFMDTPMKWAEDFDARVADLERSGNSIRESAKHSSRTLSNRVRETGKGVGEFSRDMGTLVKTSGSGAIKGAGKGAIKDGIKGATKGFASGNVVGAIAGGAGGVALGGAKGAGKGMAQAHVAQRRQQSGTKAHSAVRDTLNSKKAQSLRNQLSKGSKKPSAKALIATKAFDKFTGGKMSDNEKQNLESSSNQREFTQNLNDTNGGRAYAFATESAKTRMAGTEYVDENGNIDLSKVEGFKDDFNNKMKNGEKIDRESVDTNSKIENAFIAGAKERYETPSKSNEKQNVNSSKTNKEDSDSINRNRRGNQRPSSSFGRRTLPNKNTRSRHGTLNKNNSITSKHSNNNSTNSTRKPNNNNSTNSTRKPNNNNSANSTRKPNNNNSASSTRKPNNSNSASSTRKPSNNNSANSTRKPSNKSMKAPESRQEALNRHRKK
ncbi:hypothetical protein [Staphylococcus pseudoxylosus]|uniref:hypothetical protein n=1 Tax=Staphylococcus pseudoxylosus TaxID=2282419 RepID=UPI002DBF2496|nr:hypothetical protein [Staphylococcus pseudoxylosus]MEB6038039.1 hypothetical protein [Staphylococcus pseudoxylosus]